jgi:hypothetical protein
MGNINRIKVKEEGRKNIWIPIDKDNLKQWIMSKKFKAIHNFIPSGMMMLGADHDVKSVLNDVERADRLAVFTDSTANMGHSLALIRNNKLECYNIGKLTEKDLEIIN